MGMCAGLPALSKLSYEALCQEEEEKGVNKSNGMIMYRGVKNKGQACLLLKHKW